ncbi:MAG: radical SAM family heme chaperone HemW [Bacteroidales bacterium]|nr:radical SAM family heme chaperone HemW [Bacteroidales bacterium]
MIYVHVPFCRSFCTYCGFYSEIARGDCFEGFLSAIVAEASARKEEILKTLDVNTLYIGGGTPSVLPLSAMQRLLEALPQGPFSEFTMEANPEDIVQKGKAYAMGLKELGVNRISLGMQSFDDGILHLMNRRHDSARAVEAFTLLRECGFDNISIDLIFGMDGLSDALWEETLEKALALRPEHISAYQLSIEEGSALEELTARGQYTEMAPEQCRRQYDMLCAALSRGGYVHYEVSNFALPGHEAQHNSAYWSRVPYVGLGPGAHSFDGAKRSWNSRNPSGYTADYEILDDSQALEESIMLGLRTARGIEASLLEESTLQRALDMGTLTVSGTGRVRIPEERLFVSDDIIADILLAAESKHL